MIGDGSTVLDPVFGEICMVRTMKMDPFVVVQHDNEAAPWRYHLLGFEYHERVSIVKTDCGTI